MTSEYLSNGSPWEDEYCPAKSLNDVQGAITSNQVWHVPGPLAPHPKLMGPYPWHPSQHQPGSRLTVAVYSLM